jgi:Na+-transporting methylmalonyl-CoA/oxaloacetate decarboxylase gamma subunit
MWSKERLNGEDLMLTRYTNMTIKSQSYLFSFGFVLTLLGMALTDMWLPMVAGAMILMGLMVESWIRLAHIIPLQTELRTLKKQLEKLAQQQVDQ